MNQNIKAKRRKRVQFNMIILLLIVGYIAYKLLTGFILNPKTMVVNYGEIKNSEMLKCLFVRDEVVLKSPMEGNIEYLVKSGERIELGAVVAEIHSGDINNEDRKRLMSISEKIEDVENSNSDFFDSDVSKINHEIDELAKQIVSARKKGDYGRVNSLNASMIALADKKKRINGETYSKSTLDRLRNEQAILESNMKDSIARINIPMAGVISFNIDGYEDKLSPNNLINLTANFLSTVKVEEGVDRKSTRVIYDSPMFKLIDNSYWYVATVINDDIKRFFKVGNLITIRVEDSDAKLRVEEILKDGIKEIAILKSHQYLKSFDKYRYKEIEVIFGEHEGLKIYKDSIVIIDDVPGVYKTTYSSKPAFIPIKILGYDNDYVIIEGGSFLDNNMEKVSTVKLYDEIYRNGKKYIKE